MIVDDQRSTVNALRAILTSGGFTQVESEMDGRAALERCARRHPDLLLLDEHPSNLDGFSLLASCRATGGDEPPAVMMLIAEGDRPVRLRAMAAGADDVLMKPFEAPEVLARVRHALERRLLARSLYQATVATSARLEGRGLEVREAQLKVMTRLARAAERRHLATGQHVERVARSCGWVAVAYGLKKDEVDLILRASPLHDLGKIAIPDSILLNRATLSPEEWKVMQSHTLVGGDLLSGSDSLLLQEARTIAMAHHERWDGSGYPHGLRGEAIPLSARIVAVCDAFDAMTSDRTYQKAMSVKEAARIINEKAGTLFDPKVVEAFNRVLPMIVEARSEDGPE